MAATQAIDIYPRPRSMRARAGTFAPTEPIGLRLACTAPDLIRHTATHAAKEIGQSCHQHVKVRLDRSLPVYAAVIGGRDVGVPRAIRADPAAPPGAKDQAYELAVGPDHIALRAGGWSGVNYGLLALLDWCEAGLGCMQVADAPRFGIRSMLLHLSYNQWREKPSREVVYGFSHRLRFDRSVFNDAIALMGRLRMNMVILDVGDAVRYRSHPEIAVDGALTPDELADLLDECRNLGLEPIPKLNFATTHDAWLKDYGMIVGTEQYYEVCDNLIGELIDLFDGPRLFHIGMDEESIHHAEGLQLEHITIRRGRAWLDAVKRLDTIVQAHGARTWMWGDPLWPTREGPTPAIPKRILISDWNYSKQKTFPTSTLIEKLGYENIPAGANWTDDENAALLTRFAAEKLNPKTTPGMMMTVWNPTVRRCRGNILNAISLAAGVFWNPKGPSRAPWPRDHYGGTWTRKRR